MSIEDDRSKYQSEEFIEFRLAKGEVDGETIAIATLTDIFLLSDCDYLVGKLFF